VLDAAGKPAPNVVLWVRPTKGAKAPPPAEEVVIDQRDKKFVPRVRAVPVGTTVVFRNSDVIHHNVYSRSRSKSFDLGTYGSSESKSVSFEQPGQVDVFCAIHTNMHATILVLETHELAVTDDRGAFRIGDLEPGSRTLVVWDQIHGQHEVTIGVEPDTATILKHTLEEGRHP
jgi:plastocyanin